MKESHPAQTQTAEETSDRDIAIYVSQLLSSLQKICGNRGMQAPRHEVVCDIRDDRQWIAISTLGTRLLMT